jgi:predicted acyl esterase
MGAQFDPGSDEVAQAAFSSTPLGANPIAPAATGISSPGVVAGFATAPFASDTELTGDAGLSVRWTPNAPDTQLAAKLYDQAPDGTLTLLGRAVQGRRGAIPGQPRTLAFDTNDFSVIVHPGHRIVLTVAAGDASFYKPYADSGAGGTIVAGPPSTVTLPYRTSEG